MGLWFFCQNADWELRPDQVPQRQNRRFIVRFDDDFVSEPEAVDPFQGAFSSGALAKDRALVGYHPGLNGAALALFEDKNRHKVGLVASSEKTLVQHHFTDTVFLTLNNFVGWVVAAPSDALVAPTPVGQMCRCVCCALRSSRGRGAAEWFGNQRFLHVFLLLLLLLLICLCRLELRRGRRRRYGVFIQNM